MLKIRPYRPEDADTILGWIADETAFRKWSADRFDHYPLKPEELSSHYAAQSENETFFPICIEKESSLIGHLIMRYPGEDKTVLRFGFVILDPALRGKGYGKEMIRTALQYAFTVMDASSVTIGVFENNPAALHCYLGAGFSECGEPEYYTIGDQLWKCIELEAHRNES